ncbi:MAG: hypothetical protein EXX96DRAFT_460047, partial [Benjaminiella poitrasii]
KEAELAQEQDKLVKCEQQLQSALRQNEIQRNALKQVQAQFYEANKPIKVTDDDYSTITLHLGKLMGRIQNIPPNFKASYQKKKQNDGLSTTQLKSIFYEWFSISEKDLIDELLDDHKKADYRLISVLVEKYLMDVIVRDIFNAGIHLDKELNQAYKCIYHSLIQTKHTQWANDLRLRMAKTTADLIRQKDPHTLCAIEQSKKVIIRFLVSQLSRIYHKDNEELKERIEKLVDMAADLCLRIHGQEDEIYIYDLNQKKRSTDEHEAIYDNQVKHVYPYLHKDYIHLGITPVFLAKSITDDMDDVPSIDSYIENCTLVY